MQGNNSKVLALHQELTATMREGLRGSGLSFQRETTGQLPFNQISGTQYNVQNLVPLAEAAEKAATRQGIPAKSADMRFMTLKQANSQSLSVMEGASATKIAFLTWTDKEPVIGRDGEPEVHENGKQKMRTVQLDKPVLRVGNLFHAWDIRGNDLQYGHGRSAEENEAALDRAEALIKASGAVIVHDAKVKEAFYDRFKDRIVMPPVDSFPSREALIGETINQLAHWTGHESRLDRQSGPNGSSYRSREELTTGLGAWAVLNTLGVTGATFDNRNRHVPGMDKLLEGSQYEAMRCCKAADRIRDHLMGLEKQKDLAAEVSQEAELEAGSKTVAEGKPTHEMPGMQVMTPEQELAKAIQDAGLELGGKPIIWTGETVVLQKGKGTYSATKDVIPEATIRNRETGILVSWVGSGHKLTTESVKIQNDKTQTVRKERQTKREKAKATEKGLEAKMPPPAKSKGQSRGLGL